MRQQQGARTNSRRRRRRLAPGMTAANNNHIELVAHFSSFAIEALLLAMANTSPCVWWPLTFGDVQAHDEANSSGHGN
jgi:hypothetical protein